VIWLIRHVYITDNILQKRPIILRSLLIVATPIDYVSDINELGLTYQCLTLTYQWIMSHISMSHSHIWMNYIWYMYTYKYIHMWYDLNDTCDISVYDHVWYIYMIIYIIYISDIWSYIYLIYVTVWYECSIYQTWSYISLCDTNAPYRLWDISIYDHVWYMEHSYHTVRCIYMSHRLWDISIYDHVWYMEHSYHTAYDSCRYISPTCVTYENKTWVISHSKMHMQ